jgi:retinol dehydrogenase-12
MLDGKTVLITGATSGIGRVTAREIADMGAGVVFVARNGEKAEDTRQWIQRETGNTSVEFIVSDLSTRDGVYAAADRFKKGHAGPDILINNAGAFFARRRESADGVEMTFALNHLAPFLLTNLLLDSMKALPRARIVTVSSHAHVGARMDFDDLEGRKRYRGWSAYGQSKLGNLLFTLELARQLAGSTVTANALHPGFVATGFGKNNGAFMKAAMALAQRVGAITPEEGAQTSVYLASSPEVEGVSGKYFVKCAVAEPSRQALDLEAARRLWRVSAEMVRLPLAA